MPRSIRLLLCLLPLLLACAATPAHADDPTGGYFDDSPIDCPGAGSEVEFNRCASATLARADHELNALYHQLLAAASATQKPLLQKIQHAWIGLRDAQCALVLDYHGDAANPSAWTTRCTAAMTQRRVKELRQLGTGMLWNLAAS